MRRNERELEERVTEVASNRNTQDQKIIRRTEEHTGCFFFTGTPLKSSKYRKVWFGVSRTIYVNVDSPNLGFPYFNFLGG